MGTVYLWGNIGVYIASYLRYNGNPDVTKVSVGAIFPIIFTSISVLVPFGVGLAEKIGYRTVCLISSIMLSGAVFSSSYVKDFTLFSITYGICTGIPSGLCYMVPINNAY